MTGRFVSGVSAADRSSRATFDQLDIRHGVTCAVRFDGSHADAAIDAFFPFKPDGSRAVDAEIFMGFSTGARCDPEFGRKVPQAAVIDRTAPALQAAHGLFSCIFGSVAGHRFVEAAAPFTCG